uniref:Hematopoietic cell signal transducer n=1 Tax=Equus asinus TaxID=9793 RepID=A0A9L0IIP6_EQUAS
SPRDLATPQPLFGSSYYAQSTALESWNPSVSPPFTPQVQPQGVCDTPSASSFAPYAQSTALRVWSPSAAFLSWPPPSGSCSGCGPLSLPLLAGLVAADAVVSLLIVAVVFVCMRPRSRPTQEDGKIYINMPARG